MTATSHGRNLRGIQRLIADNATSKGMMARGAVRALQQARYEANHARRQYDAVDPDNRLVAGELERCWNETLMAVRHLEDELAAIQNQKQPALSDAEQERLMQLGADLELAWSHRSDNRYAQADC